MKKNYILYRHFYKLDDWKLCKIIVKKFNKEVCLKCGSKESINIDHIKSKSRYPKLMFDVMNMQILCGMCNKEKGHSDFTDYRDKKFIKNVLKACDKMKVQRSKIKKRALNNYLVHNYPQGYTTSLKLKPGIVRHKRSNSYKKKKYEKEYARRAYQLREYDSKIDIAKVLEIQEKLKLQLLPIANNC